MGRKRIIARDEVLDAAERVVQRDGVTNLTISAVAEQAGISKASVLYDFGTKNGLILAIVERQIQMDEERLKACIEEARREGAGDRAEVVGRIRFANSSPCEQDRASVMTLCVAMATDEQVSDRIRQFVLSDMEAFLGEGPGDPPRLMAFLALQGYLSLHYFGFCTFTDEIRAQIFEYIERLSSNTLPCDGAIRTGTG